MVLTLYKMDMSSCCRAVLLTIKALDLPVEYVEVNLLKREASAPHIAKLNPRCKIPILEDNGAVIWDSHAINAYLVQTYGKDCKLYPSDAAGQANVQGWLYFDTEIFAKLNDLMVQVSTTRTISEQTYEEVRNIYHVLNNYLKEKKWITGDNVTIADFSLLSTIESFNCCLEVDPNKYANVARWLGEAQKLPFYEVTTKKGIEDLAGFLKFLLSAKK
ncbi:hypothetical protein PPYR_09830 [Photinus pyralis]|uniref:Uncharacterized protein n=1 Tax=Photinus pyralis TaxID=7054 RepID=A0A1Y1M5I4_PHOPY|nr:glutathione S-transferase D5-like [Photinus pyralis]KAB0795769.1 hypothetical protein PPYR_09830 [Photinus pyralis]